MENDFLLQASTWGRVFELAVQRGVIACLIDQELLAPSHQSLTGWRGYKVSDISKGVIRALDITDPNTKEWIDSRIRHLLVFGYGLGWSTIRECLKHNAPKQPVLEAFWCPLTLPGTIQADDERVETAIAFQEAFQLNGEPDLALMQKGYPGRADCLMWLKSARTNRKKRKRSNNFILCLEFSYNAPSKLADFKTEEPHREEARDYARYLESRGVFARVCAEVQGEKWDLSNQLGGHLVAFSGGDKPLFKLCQASSYTEKLVRLLFSQKRLEDSCEAQAIAVTSNGLESLIARFEGSNPELDSRVKLMTSLGSAYRNARKLSENSPDELDKEVKVVFNKLVISLPPSLSKQAKQLSKELIGESLSLRLTEDVSDFHEPMHLLPIEDVISSFQLPSEFDQIFRGNLEKYFLVALKQREKAGKVTLRDAHAAAVIAGLNAAQTGRLNVIALEGNPGIGKTTAVTDFLSKQQEGYCLFYLSPRVVINRDVTSKLARKPEGGPSGILTLTTNAKLIGATPEWHLQKAQESNAKMHHIDSAVVIDGVDNLKHPICSTIFVSPEEEQRIDTTIVTSGRYKQPRNEREDRVQRRTRPGVLRTLATSARKLLDENPAIDRIVMTAAIQGYRQFANSTTIDALSKLFAAKADTKPGIQERRVFAQRIPTVIVMVDEVAGDGSGALLCHQIATWLNQQFIEPFEGEHCPFRVVLIISDASLSNEIVLDRYLNSGNDAPDKVLISPTTGDSAFQLTGTTMKVGEGKHPTLHVMTNSYPASDLQIDYSIRLAPLTPGITSSGEPQEIRKALREQTEDELLKNARLEIEQGLSQGAEQVIFFAQDKGFLRQLRQNLIERNDHVLPEQVKVIDQSVPESERLKLVQEPLRDQIRVVLMTSSGSRGVSFPKADWIIAAIPRFNIEAALMEVAQLIYRGRGKYTDPETGEKISGDRKSRKLVMLVNDFVIHDDSEDRSRRWLRQSSDLLTLLLMIRATIFTRIKGDAGLRRQRMAFVPVGFVGDEELLNLMSADLQDFLNEANVFLCDHHNQEEKGLVRRAKDLAQDLFRHFKITGMSSNAEISSYVNSNTIEDLAKSLSRPSSKLLVIPTQESLKIPKELTCIGPFWLEDWRGRNCEERFSFDTWLKDVREDSRGLLGLLTRIFENQTYPHKLKKPAKELHKLLIREKEASVREYSTLQATGTDNVFIALPLDYPHFWQKQPSDGIRSNVIEDPTTWRNALGRALTPRGTIMPVVPYYQDFPWAVVIGKCVSSNLNIVFDDRYFLASSELNLLNSLLLEDNDSENNNI